AAGDEMPSDRRIVELGGVEIEDELERNAETAELSRHMRDAIRESFHREHEDDIDAQVSQRGGSRRGRHATSPAARTRRRAGRTSAGTIVSSIGTGRAQSMP